jgi:hypothetical protein
VQSLLSRLGARLRTFPYRLSGWLIGIAVFFAIIYVLDRYLGIGGGLGLFLAIFVAAMTVAVIAWPFETRSKRRFFDRFLDYRKQPQNPVSLVTGKPTQFSEQWSSALWVPEVSVNLDASGQTLQLLSYDLTYNVLLPVAMISQLEFDPGDGPPGQPKESMSWKHKWLGRPFTPTVYLGIKCTSSEELFVYPLCFHPKLERDAEELFTLLRNLVGVNRNDFFPHSAEMLEKRLPPSFESRFLRTTILQRFWPDYRAKTIREWLNR